MIRKRNVCKIIIHHTATDANTTVDAIRRVHIEKRKFSDIGYHALVDARGVAHPGRPVTRAGAHCRGHNTGTLGLAFIGYYHPPQNQRLEDIQLETAARLCALWCELYDIRSSDIYPHSDFGHTACPGDNVRARLGELRVLTQKYLDEIRRDPRAYLEMQQRFAPAKEAS
jgi:N-acetylmuramoyl-L-alanine amidase